MAIISHQLLLPIIERLHAEYEELQVELKAHPAEETDKIRSFVLKKMDQLEQLLSSASANNTNVAANGYLDIRESLRDLKVGLRSAQRRWRRYLLNEVRFKTVEQKDTLISSFAA